METVCEVDVIDRQRTEMQAITIHYYEISSRQTLLYYYNTNLIPHKCRDISRSLKLGGGGYKNVRGV